RCPARRCERQRGERGDLPQGSRPERDRAIPRPAARAVAGGDVHRAARRAGAARRGMNPSRRRLVTVLGLVAVSLFCVALVLFRFAESGSTNFMGLIWNLFLAWIPFGLAVAVYDRWRRHGPAALLLVLGALWL